MHELAWVWRRCRSIATTGGVHRVRPAQGAPVDKSASPGSASRPEGDSVAPHAAHTRVSMGSSAGCVPPCQPCRECVNSTAAAVTVIARGMIRLSCLRGRCLVGRGARPLRANSAPRPHRHTAASSDVRVPLVCQCDTGRMSASSADVPLQPPEVRTERPSCEARSAPRARRPRKPIVVVSAPRTRRGAPACLASATPRAVANPPGERRAPRRVPHVALPRRFRRGALPQKLPQPARLWRR